MLKSFAEVLDIYNGKNQKHVEDSEGIYPIYGSGGIMGYANDYICPENTVIIGRKGSINKPFYVSTPIWNVDTAFGLVAKKDILNSKYLYYFCEYYNFEKLNTTVTIPSLTKANLLKIFIEIPELNEQINTVKRLDKVNYIIQKRKEELEQIDILVKSRFVEMFGDPVENPMEWETLLCKEAAIKIGSGATPKGGRESYGTEGISLIRSMNVYNNRFEYKDLAYIGDEQAKKLDNVTIEKNDLLINITGASVARCCIVPEEILPARVNQHVSIIRCKEMLLPEFVCHMLTESNYQKQLWNIAISSGATREAITKQQIEELTFIVPSIDLQEQFAAFVRQTTKLKLEIQKSLDETQTLMDSLMQEYFG